MPLITILEELLTNEINKKENDHTNRKENKDELNEKFIRNEATTKMIKWMNCFKHKTKKKTKTTGGKNKNK